MHFSEPNPAIDFAATPFTVNARLQDWPRQSGQPRRAGVSSFGVGGTNAHLVLEEAPLPAEPCPSKAAAEASGLPLYRYLGGSAAKVLPVPMSFAKPDARLVALNAVDGPAFGINDETQADLNKPLDGKAGIKQEHLNPALGLRAIRWSLADPAMFLTQLRAILRAAAHGEEAQGPGTEDRRQRDEPDEGARKEIDAEDGRVPMRRERHDPVDRGKGLGHREDDQGGPGKAAQTG